MYLAGRLDLPPVNHDLVALEVEVHELHLVVVVDADHVLGADPEAKASSCESDDPDFEGGHFRGFDPAQPTPTWPR